MDDSALTADMNGDYCEDVAEITGTDANLERYIRYFSLDQYTTTISTGIKTFAV